MVVPGEHAGVSAFELVPWDCPTCGAAPQRVLGLRGGRSHRAGAGTEVRIVRCRRCGLIFPNPFPVPREVDDLYGDPTAYFAGHDSTVKVRNGRRMIRDLVALTDAAEPRVLDVGSGMGELLEAARLEGIAAAGIELSPAMANAARERFDADVRVVTIEDLAGTETESFDVIVMSSVLEHVHRPDATVAAAKALLRPGGVLYLELPSEPNLLTIVGNAVLRLRRARPPSVLNLSPTFPPYHVYGFNGRSLGRLLAAHGLRIERRRVWADPRLQGGIAARAGTFVNRVANVIGLAANMEVWVRHA